MFMDYFHFIGHFFPRPCHFPDPVFRCPPWHWTSFPNRLPAFTLTHVLSSLHSRSCDPFLKTITLILLLLCNVIQVKIKNPSPYCKPTNTYMVWPQNPFNLMSYHSATPATGAYLLIWEHTQHLPSSRGFYLLLLCLEFLPNSFSWVILCYLYFEKMVYGVHIYVDM